MRLIGWAGVWGGVLLVGGVGMGQGSSMREGLARCLVWVGVGKATAQGPSWPLANSAITPHSEQLAQNG